MNKDIIAVIKKHGIQKATGTTLQNTFDPFFQRIKEWDDNAKALEVTAEDQTDKMQAAQKARFQLRDIRTGADKKRADLKKETNAYNAGVQEIFKVIELTINPIEAYLLKQEKFAEVNEKERVDAARIASEAGTETSAEFMPEHAARGIMSDDGYAQALKAAKLLKVDSEKEAEKDEPTPAETQATTEDNDRLEAENKKLRLENITHQKKQTTQAEAVVAQDRSDDIAHAAPDPIKLIKLAGVIDALEFPDVKTARAENILSKVRLLLNKTATYIIANAEKI